MFSSCLVLLLGKSIYASAAQSIQHSEILQLAFTLISDGCPIDTPVSCSNGSSVADLCCTETPGGVILQSQFWNYYPPFGEDDSFTIHGMWSDNCDFTYPQFCNNSLAIRKSIKSIISDDFQDPELYSSMSQNWVSNNKNDKESLWLHEFNKHGTCMSTISPQCYKPEYKMNQNVYDYFKITMNLYKKLDTFQALWSAGIFPHPIRTYTRTEIAAALNRAFEGHRVYFKCDRNKALTQVWYFHHLKGSVRNEQFIKISSLHAPSCPEEGIHFYPKGWNPHKNQFVQNWPSSNTIKGWSYKHTQLSEESLINSGKYSQQGTCATFQLQNLVFGGYNLESSPGNCGFDDQI